MWHEKLWLKNIWTGKRTVNVFFLSFVALFIATVSSLPAAAQSDPTPIFVQRIESRPLTEKLEALGTLRANEATVLSASVTETVTAIHFDDNQQVEAGQVLVEMTSAEEHAQLEEAISTLDEAERQFVRVKSLAKTNLATASQLDQQRASVEAARAQLRAVQSRLQDRLIIAPFKGVVGLRNISVGALVRPGDIITTLDDNSVMKLDMEVSSIYLGHLHPGLTVEARAAALEGRVFIGTITSIGSRIDPVTRSLTVRAKIPNTDGILRPGMLMTTTLSKPERTAIMINEEAVTQVGKRSYVYVVESESDSQVVHQRDVKLGVRQTGLVEIVDGLSEGEQIVVHGAIKLRDGAAVTVAAVAEAGDRLTDLLAK